MNNKKEELSKEYENKSEEYNDIIQKEKNDIELAKKRYIEVVEKFKSLKIV